MAGLESPLRDLHSNYELTSAFHFSVSDGLLLDRIAWGRFLKSHLCLAFTTNDTLISVHNFKDKSQERIQLNARRPITHLTSCPVEDTKDVLVIAHSNNIACYDVEENRQLFFNDVESTVECLMAFLNTNTNSSLILVGGLCTLQGFDLKGKEALWILTSDRVTALTDFERTKGIGVLLAATARNEIVSFDLEKKGKKEESFQEADRVEFLVDLGGSVFGYGLKNGTIGAYRNGNRLWRIKSKHKLQVLAAIDVYNDSHVRLINGWFNGKIEIRKATTGEVLFRENLNASIVSIVSADLRNSEAKDLVACTTKGEIRGFSLISSLPTATQMAQILVSKENAFAKLNEKLKEMLYEAERLENACHLITNGNQTPRRQKGITSNDLMCCLTADMTSKNLKLIIRSSKENAVFKGGLAFGENVFENESKLVVFPSHRNNIGMTFAPERDIETGMDFNVFVSKSSKDVYQIVNVYQRIPKFAMYALIHPGSASKKPKSYAMMLTSARLSKLRTWKKEKFILPNDGFSEDDRSYFECLRSGNVLSIAFEACNEHQKVTLRCDAIDVVGSVLQDLCQYLEIKDLTPVFCFPIVMNDLQERLLQLQSFDLSDSALESTMAKSIPSMKSLAIQAEDARMLKDMPRFRSRLIEMHRLGQELNQEHIQRRQNKELYMQTLKSTSAHLQALSNLYIGNVRERILKECKECLKRRETGNLLDILSGLQIETPY